MRLHVRAIVRDGTRAFVGSQSLRKDELENRREVGFIINNPGVARKIMQVFDDGLGGLRQGRKVKDRESRRPGPAKNAPPRTSLPH